MKTLVCAFVFCLLAVTPGHSWQVNAGNAIGAAAQGAVNVAGTVLETGANVVGAVVGGALGVAADVLGAGVKVLSAIIPISYSSYSANGANYNLPTYDGWIVVMNRYTGGNENFNRNWKDYKAGFGSHDGEFWLGNEIVYQLTNSGRHYKLRVELLFASDRTWYYAEYDSFELDSEKWYYGIHVSGYRGNVNDALSGGSKTTKHDTMYFTTNDWDYDKQYLSNCAKVTGGAWWFNGCDDTAFTYPYTYQSCLTGTKGSHFAWARNGRLDQLLGARIFIRPTN